MSFAAAAVLVALATAVGIPLVVLGVAVVLGRRPNWVPLRRRRHRADPNIHAYLMLAVLVVVAVALLFLLPWAVAFGGLAHKFTGAEGVFLAALTLLGLCYAWRRGVLRWQ
jgi:NADH:ubiquinone oxidoreductase subunit 3 (subunit A)